MLIACLTLSLSVASAEPVLLKGIPRARWDRAYGPVAILHAALSGMGCRMSYDELLVASGAAFRMSWRPGQFDWGVIGFYQQDPLAVGGAAAGAQVERRQFATVGEAYDAAVAAIDAGRPVIAWTNALVEWQIICGYDAATHTLFRRTIYTSDQPEQCPAEALKSCSGSYSDGPYELWLLDYDATKPQPKLDWPFIIANALRLARWDDADRYRGFFVCGESAYYSWATDLRNSTLYQKWPLPGRMSWSHAALLEESRGAVARLLRANTGVHAGLAQAALLYEDEATLFGQVQKTLCGGARLSVPEATKVAEEYVKDAKIRETCADLIEQALAKDKAARAALTTALKDLAPDLLPVENAQPAPQ